MATEADIRAELQRIVASPAFDVSLRNRRFLSYVVEETLCGRGERIKAYSVATQVFGRGDDFDAQEDSIVRIEAARLRRGLEHFYLVEGGASPVRITLPKGTYVPEFIPRQEGAPECPTAAPEPPAPVEPASPLHELGPRIMVAKFEQEGDCEPYRALGRTLARRLISALTRFTEIFVYGHEAAEGLEGLPDGCPLRVDYWLTGTVAVSDGVLRVELLLRRAGDGRYVWAHDVERPLDATPGPAGLVRLSSEIAGSIARIIAERDGIMDSQARESPGDPPRHYAGYQKILDFQEYWRTLDPALFEPLRRDLERTILRDPRFAAAFACLSLLYSNAARYAHDIEACPRPLERAMDLAATAIRLAPNSSGAHHARAVAEWFSGQPEASLATLRIARALNPNNSEVLAELGFRLAMRMDWEAAVPLINEAYLRNPLQAGQYRMGLFLHHFAEGRPERALEEVRAIGAPGNPQVQLGIAAALSEMGRLPEARAHLGEMERLAPGLLARLAEDLGFRQIHPTLIAAILRAIGRIDPEPVRAIRMRPRGNA